MKQNTIKPNVGSKKARKRVGRGGNRAVYAGRGMNGQNSRSGGGVRVGFEGGQSPLLRRMPKLKGFNNINKVTYFALNTRTLEQFDDGTTVDLALLLEKGILKKPAKLKLLATGDLKKKINVTVDAASAAGIKKVEKAGGKVTILSEKDEKVEKKENKKDTK